MYAILNTKTGRLLKVEAVSQSRHYPYESPKDYPVIKVHDSCFPGIVYCQDEASAVQSLLDPDPPDHDPRFSKKYKDVYKDVYIDYFGFTRTDLQVVILIQVTA